MTAVFSILGTFLLGMAADRYGHPIILALTYALRGGAFLLLLFLPAGNLFYVYGIVLGISWTATTPLTAAIAVDQYGPKNLGIIFGTMFTFMNVGSGVGSLLDGVIFETTGGYTAALLLNVALGIAAAAAVVLAPRFGVERPRRRAPHAAPDHESLPAHAAD
jgi:MFS family permease